MLPDEVTALLHAQPDRLLVDARGLRCPLPVLRLRKAAREAAGGSMLLLATDPAALADVPAFCAVQNWQVDLLAAAAPLLVFVVTPAGR